MFSISSRCSIQKIMKSAQIKTPANTASKYLNCGLKVLGGGELEKKITVKAHKFSKTASEKIEAAGGKAEVI